MKVKRNVEWLHKLLKRKKEEPVYESKYGLRFRKPQTIEDSILVIERIIPYIEIWASKRSYCLFMLAAMNIRTLWPVIQKCVLTQEGLTLEMVKEKDCSMGFMVNACGVFCEGLMREELPGVYLTHIECSPVNGFYNLIAHLREFEEYLTRKKVSEEDAFNHLMAATFEQGMRRVLGMGEKASWQQP